MNIMYSIVNVLTSHQIWEFPDQPDELLKCAQIC